MGQAINPTTIDGSIYADVSDLAHRLSEDATDSDVARRMTAALAAASRRIDDMTGRVFHDYAGATITRPYVATNRRLLTIDDLHGDMPALSQAGRTISVDTYRVAPSRIGYPCRLIISDDLSAWHASADPVMVTSANWGWADTPAPVTEACLLIAARFVKREQSPLGVYGVAEFGASIHARAGDPDAAQLLAPYNLITVA